MTLTFAGNVADELSRERTDVVKLELARKALRIDGPKFPPAC